MVAKEGYGNQFYLGTRSMHTYVYVEFSSRASRAMLHGHSAIRICHTSRTPCLTVSTKEAQLASNRSNFHSRRPHATDWQLAA